MHRIGQAIVALLLLGLSIHAWAGNVPRVLVSIKPIHSLVAGIMQGVGQPQLIVSGDSTPYGYTLSKDQLNALNTANIVVWTGAELEPFLAFPLAQLNGSSMILELLDNSELKVLPARGQDDDARDPFMWLDTRNALILVEELSKAIINYDSENEQQSLRNTTTLLEEISNLDREFEYGYRSVNSGKAFLYHDTLQYFEQAYGTRVVGTLSAKPGDTPGVTAFLDARSRIYDANLGVNCIMTEAGLPTDNLSILITGSRVKVVELDSFGSHLEPGPKLYGNMMRQNFNAIKSCLEKGGDVIKLGATPVAETTGTDNEVLPSKIKGKYILKDQFSRTVRNSDFENVFQLITFGYTSCPDICPTTLQVISGAMKRLGEAGNQVQPLFITVDPQRDTVDVLNRYISYFHPRLLGLTGTQSMIDRVLSQFKVRVEKEYLNKTTEDIYTVNHTAGTYLLAPGGQFLKKFTYGTTSIDMAAGIERYLETR
jgi:ABC-type Zn2+ transport system substrate-binding protein/surface adhesin/cytochrome oxidase Cu insertion factor (SCO1/SenC/PrrC family)